MDFQASIGTQKMSFLDQNVFPKRPLFMADLGKTKTYSKTSYVCPSHCPSLCPHPGGTIWPWAYVC